MSDEKLKAALEEKSLTSPSSVAQKRCKRCQVFYTESTNGECRYHSARFIEIRSLHQGINVGWQCCHVKEWLPYGGVERAHPVMNEAALKRNCPGCCTAPQHLEDEVYSRCIENFPLDTQAAIAAAIQHKKEEEEEIIIPEEAQAQVDAQKQADEFNAQNADLVPYYLHPVATTDTLQGLSLRFNVKISELQKLNKLPNQQIFHLKFIRIPKSPEEVEKINAILAGRNAYALEIAKLRSRQMQDKIALQTFKKSTGVFSNEEARFYLNETGFNADAAIALWKEDMEWAENNQHLFNNPNREEAIAKLAEKDKARHRRRQNCFCFVDFVDLTDEGL